MKKILFALTIFASLSIIAKDLTIVDNGRPAAEIVIPQDAPYLLQFAAKELQEHIKKISRTELAIVENKSTKTNKLIKIFIGISPDEKNKEKLRSASYDTYRIICCDGNIYLFGRDYYGKPMFAPQHPFRLAQTWNPKLKLSKYGETGSLYAVYGLLRQLGVRWFMPGDIGTVIPDKKTIKVKSQNITASPDFYYRYIYYNDFNGDQEGTLWYRRVGLGAERPLCFMHTFNILLRKLKKDNPECLALINGKRDFTTTCMGQGSMCLSNPRTFEETVKFVQEKLKKTESYNIFPIVPQDGYKRSCACKICIKKTDFDAPDDGILSNYVWTFLNKVALKIGQTNPKQRLGALAYSCYRMPPDKVKNISPNLDVMYCYHRAMNYSPETARKNWKSITEWSKRCKNLYDWNYYLFWHEGSSLNGAPIIFTRIISNDFANIQGKIKGEFIEGSKVTIVTDKKRKLKSRKMASPGMQHLNVYVTAQLYWNNKLNIDELLDDYYHKFYGPAASIMQTFFEKAEKMWIRPYYRGFYGKNALISKIFPLKELENLMHILNQAAAKVQQSKNQRYLARINILRKELQFFINTRHKTASSQKAVYRCKKIYSEKYPTPEKWAKASSINLEKALDGRKSKIKTQIKMLKSKKHIFLQIDCFEKNLKDIKTGCKKHDGYIWGDDTFQLFMMVPGTKKYFQVVVNSLGTVWDGEWEIGKDKGRQQPAKWESKVKCHIKPLTDRWQIQLALPLESFKRTIKANFMRTKHINGRKKIFSWVPSFNSNIHDTTIFGSIK